MTVISTLSTFWLEITSFASPLGAVAAEANHMPSARFASVLRTSTLLRQLLFGGAPPPGPVQALPKVSPNAVSTSPPPLSHMMPRSVLLMSQRPQVLLTAPGPVSFSITVAEVWAEVAAAGEVPASAPPAISAVEASAVAASAASTRLRDRFLFSVIAFFSLSFGGRSGPGVASPSRRVRRGRTHGSRQPAGITGSSSSLRSPK
jgi:hypothetical protein